MPPADLRGALLARFHERTEPEDTGGPQERCVTPLVRQLQGHWNLFSTAERAEITDRLRRPERLLHATHPFERLVCQANSFRAPSTTALTAGCRIFRSALMAQKCSRTSSVAPNWAT